MSNYGCIVITLVIVFGILVTMKIYVNKKQKDVDEDEIIEWENGTKAAAKRKDYPRL